MTKVLYTSDTHFSHKLVAGLRGFENTHDHDQAIIANWNSVVRPLDTVWHLGDVGMGHFERWADQFSELNGTIHLVTGNHDDVFPGNRDSWKYQCQWMYGDRFASVQAFTRRKVEGRYFLLSHFPYDGDHTGEDRYTQYRLRDDGMWLLHGHTHLKTKLSPEMRQEGHMLIWRGRQLHVGLDAWALKPVTQDEVVRVMAEVDKSWDAA
jgi:calcineurin-like phosphoesterase family protein